MKRGPLENVTLPDGRVAKPVSGRGSYTTYEVDGTRVDSRSGNPHDIAMRVEIAKTPGIFGVIKR